MKIKLNSPDGKSIVLNAPDGASEDEVRSYAQKAMEHYQSQAAPQQTNDKVPLSMMDKAKGMAMVAKDVLMPRTPMGQIQNKLNQAGEDIATGKLQPGMEFANVRPEDQNATVRGLMGGAVANAPDLVLGAEALRPSNVAGIANGVRALGRKMVPDKVKAFLNRPTPQELRAGMQAAANEFGQPETTKAIEQGRKIVDEAKTAADTNLAPARMKLNQAKAAQDQIKSRFAEVEKTAEARLSQAKSGLDKAETKADTLFTDFADPRFQKFVKSPEKMAGLVQRTTRMVRQAGGTMDGEAKAAADIAGRLKPQRVQLYRKLLQEGRDTLSGGAQAQLNANREVFSQALTYGDDYFKSARAEFHAAKNALDQLPVQQSKTLDAARNSVREAGRELATLQNRMKQLTDEANQLSRRMVQDARLGDAAALRKLKAERLRLIEQAEAYEKKLSRAMKIAGAGAAVAAGGGAVAAIRRAPSN